MASHVSWAKADNPLWSNHVVALVPRRARSGELLSETLSFADRFVQWARHLLSAEEPGASAWHIARSGVAARRDDGYQDGDRAEPA